MERKDVLTVSLHMDHGSWGPSHTQSLHVSARLAEGWGDGMGWDGMGTAWRTVVPPHWVDIYSDRGSMGAEIRA